MTFPLAEYEAVSAEAKAICLDRDEKGRNDDTPFWAGWPHGHQDISFEMKRRVARILGAEHRGRLEIAREDALDLLNYAAFYVMLLDRQQGQPSPYSDHSPKISIPPGSLNGNGNSPKGSGIEGLVIGSGSSSLNG